MNDYLTYKSALGETPEFLKKYLELDIVKRLKGVSLLCGMDYASKYAYDFKCYFFRLNSMFYIYICCCWTCYLMGYFILRIWFYFLFNITLYSVVLSSSSLSPFIIKVNVITY